MTKRIFDFLVSIIGLLLLAPIILLFMLLVWLQDWHSPFYIAPRVGKNGVLFMMIKLRSMVINADKTGVDSTSNDDKRITMLGGIIRRYKLDEITQLLNVIIGKMSLVGPRPQVESDVLLYTKEEKKLLNEKPGITDFSSIIFSDEGKYNKENYDCFFENNVKATDGRTTIRAENLDLLSAEDFASIYNKVMLDNDEGLLWADKVNYDFNTELYKVTMFDEKKVKVKLFQ